MALRNQAELDAMTTEDMANAIRDEMKEMDNNASRIVVSAMRTGQLLFHAKKKLKHTEYTPFFESLKIPKSTAYRWRRFYEKHKDKPETLPRTLAGLEGATKKADLLAKRDEKQDDAKESLIEKIKKSGKVTFTDDQLHGMTFEKLSGLATAVLPTPEMTLEAPKPPKLEVQRAKQKLGTLSPADFQVFQQALEVSTMDEPGELTPEERRQLQFDTLRIAEAHRRKTLRRERVKAGDTVKIGNSKPFKIDPGQTIMITAESANVSGEAEDVPHTAE